MAQQYPPPNASAGGRGGGRNNNSGRGGRGSFNNHYSSNNNSGRGGGGGGNPMGAWQPAPTNNTPGAPPPYHPQQQQQQQQPQQQQQQQQRGGPTMVPQAYGMPPPGAYYNPYAAPPPQAYHPQQQAQQQQQHRGGQPQQQQYGAPPPPPPGAYGGGMRGGVFYPPPPPPPQQQQRAGSGAPQPPGGAPPQTVVVAPVAAPAPRAKKPLVITDKEGNVIDLSSSRPTTKKTTTPAAATVTPPVPPKSDDAGAKLRQMALERLGEGSSAEHKQEDAAAVAAAKKKAEQEAKEKAEAEEKAKKEAEEKAKKEAAEAEQKAKQEAEEKAKQEAAAAAAKEKAEAEEKAKQEAAEKVKEEAAAEAEPPKSSLAALLSKPPTPAAKPPSVVVPEGSRRVYTKEILLQFKDLPYCLERPESLPDMTVTRGAPANKGRGGGDRGGGDRGGGRRGSRTGGDGGDGGGSEWSRGNAPPRRQSSHGDRGGGGGGGGGGGNEWTRGQAMPRPPPNQQRDNRGGRGRGGRHNQPPLYDGPVEPLVKTENHWRPRKNTSALVVAEKKVKGLLNKMTKEKFDRLSAQMLEIPILSYEILTMMIDTVYDKAIDEPSFGDMYADLCVRLSQTAQGNKFVHIIESDEEPPTDDGEAAPTAGDESSSHTVYRWSNDISTSDAEIVGPLASQEACIEAAFDEEERTPVERGDMELDLVSVSIKRGIFIKIMKKKGSAEGDEDVFYAVYFPAAEAKECGQQLSEIFLSQVECQADASKKNTFKRSLLNKCEEEFNKQDIYVDWKKERKEYEESKSKLTDAERAEKEAELSFRRIRIKKQMLGNVKFIGQLYKKGLLKEKIMRYCIASLLKLEERKDVKGKNPEYNDSGSTDMDEEDHEAICSMFATIGATIDKPHATEFMRLCFSKIDQLSNSKSLPSRSRFMYKDLLELRDNGWVPRRKEEKAKTIAEIRKDVEREERRQAQQSAQQNRGGRGGGGDYRSSGRGGGDYRGRQSTTGGNRPRQPKPATQTDEDGFTVIPSSRSSFTSRGAPLSPPRSSPTRPSAPQVTPTGSKPKFAALADDNGSSSKPEPLSEEKLEGKIKSMRSDFVSDGGIVEEVLLTWEEMAGTPDAGKELVMKNADRMMDCKDNERQAINRIIAILCEKGKLSREDVQDGLMDAVEFIDSFVMDSPRAYDYLGDLLADMLRLKMVDMSWLCDQCEKTKIDPGTQAPEKLVRSTLLALKKSAGADAAKAQTEEKKLTGLLGADTLSSISQEL